MTIDHWIRLGQTQGFCRLSLLRLLREDPHSATIKVFDNPRMMNVKSIGRPGLTGPAMPSDPARTLGGRSLMLDALSLHGEAKGFKVESIPVSQQRAGAIVEAHIG
ncbi:hypothetical protein AVW14_20740 [Stenotrophomonas maltophilia]|nr:hypothetical protein WJ66_01624 [Stenotrophomonas maltophilia WJ66]KOO79046.1 hypothetical protein VO93_10850 [Stenotrophomonas maltophilia]KRG45593.1 hypothetical protein ARC63_06925 [Stenotrophomonas geniculata ATCC 19374 = JCM 13324]KZE40486.1 hypothetical protein AVW14_20740 [Stenotrophomonas maltophilia]